MKANPLVAMAILLATLNNVSCQKIPKPPTSGTLSGNSAKDDVLSGSRMSEIVLRVLGARLRAQANLSNAQADLVVNTSRSRLESKAASLQLLGDSPKDYYNDYSRFSADMTVGAMLSFIKPELGVTKRSDINKILGVIISNTFLEMKGRMTNIDDPSFPRFISSLTNATASALVSVGYGLADIDNAIETIMKSAIGNLRLAGILSQRNGAAVTSAVVAGTVMSLSQLANIKATALIDDTSTATSAFPGMPTSATASCGTTTPCVSGMPTISSDLPTGATYTPVTLDASNIASFDPTQQYKNFDPSTLQISVPNPPKSAVYAVTLYKLMKGAVPALKDAGFSNDELVSAVKYVVYSMVSTLGDAGLDMYGILGVINEGVYGALDSVKDLGLDTNAMIEAIGNIAGGAASSISSIRNLDADNAYLVVETAVYIVSSRASKINGMTGKTLERAYEQIVASSTHGLSAAGLKDDKYVENTSKVVATIMVTASQSQQSMPDSTDDMLNPTELAKGLAAAALATTNKDKKFADKLKTSIKGNDKFKKVVGPMFDYDSWFSAASNAANYMAGFATQSDPFAKTGIPVGPVISQNGGISPLPGAGGGANQGLPTANTSSSTNTAASTAQDMSQNGAAGGTNTSGAPAGMGQSDTAVAGGSTDTSGSVTATDSSTSTDSSAAPMGP